MRYAHLSPDARRDAVRLLDAPAHGNLTAHKAGSPQTRGNSRRKRVPAQGFEPQFEESKSSVLPLDDAGKTGGSLADFFAALDPMGAWR